MAAPYHTGLEHGSGHDVEGGARGGAAGGGDYDLRAGADSMMPLMSVEDTEAFQLFTSEMFDPSIFEELQQSPHENRSQPMSTGHHHHHHLGQHQHQQQYYLHHEAPHTRHLQHDASGGQDKSDGSSHGLW